MADLSHLLREYINILWPLGTHMAAPFLVCLSLIDILWYLVVSRSSTFLTSGQLLTPAPLYCGDQDHPCLQLRLQLPLPHHPQHHQAGCAGQAGPLIATDCYSWEGDLLPWDDDTHALLYTVLQQLRIIVDMKERT